MQPSEPTTKFTAGPWRHETSRYRAAAYVVQSSRETVSFDVRREEDARLIAAAPDLYAAASEIIRLHDAYTGEARDDDAISVAMDDLRAALHRARGEG